MCRTSTFSVKRRRDLNSQDKKHFLKRYWDLDRKINRLLQKKEQWYAKATKITSTISDMPHGGDGENQRELAISEMIDCDMEANRLIDQLYDLKKQILCYIIASGDTDEHLLMILRVEK